MGMKFITVSFSSVRVARLGEIAPFGRLLAAVGALKFGCGASLAISGRLFETLGSIWLHKKITTGLLFASFGRHDFHKIWQQYG